MLEHTHTQTDENLEICSLSDFLPHMTCLTLNLWTKINSLSGLRVAIASHFGLKCSSCHTCALYHVRSVLLLPLIVLNACIGAEGISEKLWTTAVVVPQLTARWLFNSSVALHTSVIVNKMDDQCYKYRGASRLGRVPAVPFKFLQFWWLSREEEKGW